MAYYPLLFQLSGCRCLVVGAGRVGARKIAALLERDPLEVLALDPQPPSAELAPFLDHPALVYASRPFCDDDVAGRALVFAATSDTALNSRVAAACKARGVPCNVADAPGGGDFIVPASLERGGVCLSIATGGRSPALSRMLKAELAEWLENTLADAPLLELLGLLRPRIVALGLGSDAHAAVFRSLAEKPFRQELGPALSRGERERCLELLYRRTPAALHPELALALDQVLAGFSGPSKEPSHDLS